MKTYAYIYRIVKMLVLSLSLMCVSTSCHLDPPDGLTPEEIYMRNFVKKFGLIDPNQDFNLAKSAQITIAPDRLIHNLDVYVRVVDEYYLVAQYTEVDERVTIPIDVPELCQDLMIVADGMMIESITDEVIHIGENRAPQSRAGDESAKLNSEPLKWLLVAEDMGTSEEFDFNDIIVQLSTVSVNAQKNSAKGERLLTVRALAAGGTLPLYLHFKDDLGDRILGPQGTALVTDPAIFKQYEWHKWFRNAANLGYTTTTMINTGESTATAAYASTMTFVVSSDFSLAEYSKLNYTGSVADSDYYAQWKAAQARDASKLKGFYITVGSPFIEHCESVLYAPAPGVPPQMFLIPDVKPLTIDGSTGWMWPQERTDIRHVYPKFNDWMSDPSIEWYLYPNANAQRLLFRIN